MQLKERSRQQAVRDDPIDGATTHEFLINDHREINSADTAELHGMIAHSE